MVQKICCFGWTNKQGALILVQISILMGFGLLAGELVEYFLKHRPNAGWKIYYLFLSPVFEIFFSLLALHGCRHANPKTLLPLLWYKTFYVIVYSAVFVELFAFITSVPSNQSLDIFKYHFGIVGDDAIQNHQVSFIISICIFVLMSTMICPMEVFLRLSFPVVVGVFSSYFIIVIALEIYFVVVVYIVYLELKEDKLKSEVNRYVINPVPTVRTYSMQPDATSLPQISSPPKTTAFIRTVERKHSYVVPSNSLPLGIN